MHTVHIFPRVFPAQRTTPQLVFPILQCVVKSCSFLFKRQTKSGADTSPSFAVPHYITDTLRKDSYKQGTCAANAVCGDLPHGPKFPEHIVEYKFLAPLTVAVRSRIPFALGSTAAVFIVHHTVSRNALISFPPFNTALQTSGV